MSPAFANLIRDLTVLGGAEVSVSKSGNLKPGEADPAKVHEFRNDLFSSTQEVDAEPVGGGSLQERFHEIDTRHALRHELSRCANGPNHRHAVRHDHIGRGTRSRQLRILPHHAKVRRINGHDHVRTLRTTTEIDTARDGLIQRDCIEHDIQ